MKRAGSYTGEPEALTGERSTERSGTAQAPVGRKVKWRPFVKRDSRIDSLRSGPQAPVNRGFSGGSPLSILFGYFLSCERKYLAEGHATFS